ncbi:hypothetical protein FLJC2902T_21490 [Flavobacterium limnosediminis JC2902]|uniref:Uncharacterized protein n=1 Tax=Flavobacterium limnosediminis JC2902 TaxID=1341181 RepID=V6SLS5_9FLAO|nr:hypothetical protein FLJC2902T_21490 [Flavobacterium limnosediminis JC2902]
MFYNDLYCLKMLKFVTLLALVNQNVYGLRKNTDTKKSVRF